MLCFTNRNKKQIPTLNQGGYLDVAAICGASLPPQIAVLHKAAAFSALNGFADKKCAGISGIST